MNTIIVVEQNVGPVGILLNPAEGNATANPYPWGALNLKQTY